VISFVVPVALGGDEALPAGAAAARVATVPALSTNSEGGSLSSTIEVALGGGAAALVAGAALARDRRAATDRSERDEAVCGRALSGAGSTGGAEGLAGAATSSVTSTSTTSAGASGALQDRADGHRRQRVSERRRHHRTGGTARPRRPAAQRVTDCRRGGCLGHGDAKLCSTFQNTRVMSGTFL
jgi:hypothetical protein